MPRQPDSHSPVWLEAWGVELTESKSTGTAVKAVGKASSQHTAARQQWPIGLHSSARQLPGVPSLESICLGCLAEHLDAVLAAGPELLSRFPWEWKAALLAVARRSGVLEDRTLALLADAEMPVLDLAGAQRLTAAGVDSVLQGMPALRAADLSFPEFHSSLIGTLQSGCPQLEVLWLGGIGPGMGSRTIKALLQALPRLQHREAVGESWEDIAEDEGSGAQGLISLRCLIWPELPQLAQLTLQRHAPQLRIVDAKDSGPALDEPYARQVAQYDWAAALQRREASQACSGSGAGGVREQQREMPAGSSSAVISLADRFRMAYESRAARVAVVRERNARKERRRELRAMGGAERALVMAEAGVPLVPQSRGSGRPR